MCTSMLTLPLPPTPMETHTGKHIFTDLTGHRYEVKNRTNFRTITATEENEKEEKEEEEESLFKANAVN
jgi:hypothetical protein